MTTEAATFYETWPARMGTAKSHGPAIGRAFGPFFQGLMGDNPDGLSTKEKELIALGIAVAVRCSPCMYAHVEKCLKAGATAEEVMDAAGVAVMMGGGPAYTQIPIVAEALEHLAKGG